MKGAVFLIRRDLLLHRSAKFASIVSKIPEENVSESSHTDFGTYFWAINDHKSTFI